MAGCGRQVLATQLRKSIRALRFGALINKLPLTCMSFVSFEYTSSMDKRTDHVLREIVFRIERQPKYEDWFPVPIPWKPLLILIGLAYIAGLF